MIPKSLQSVLSNVGSITQAKLAAFVGCIIGLSVPVIALMLAALLRNLIAAQMKIDAHEIPGPSRYLPDVQAWLSSESSALTQLCWLLGATLCLLALTAGLLYVLYRLVQSAAVDFEIAVIERLRDQSRLLATARTLSAQSAALTDCHDYHLPRVRSTLARWWQAFPRHAVQLGMCAIFMMLVQPMLSVLTIVATALVYLIFRFFDRRRRMALPVVRERAGQLRTDLSNLCLQGPLLESVHDAPEVEARFAEQLDHYRRDAFRSLSSSAWKTPVVIACTSLIAGVFLFLIAVQILRSDANFTVPGAFAFTLCFIGAVVSCVRLQQSYRGLQSVSNAAEALDEFLSIKTESFDPAQLGSIERVVERIELDHVTLQDSSSRKLLEDVSLTLQPGTLIGIVASHPLQARALSELLMGFGRPVSGRLLFDGKPVTDLDPQSINATAQWVASSGGIATGTVQDNILRGDSSQAGVLNEVIESAKLVEVMQALPDALHTLITPDDDRLRGDTPFRIGIARAAASKASIVVVEEPAKQFDADAEKHTLAAIQSLVSHDRIVVCLPQRLLTLRSCSQVVMVENHTVTDTGTHNELLQRNEYYRHLNYLRFNPFQSVEN